MPLHTASHTQECVWYAGCTSLMQLASLRGGGGSLLLLLRKRLKHFSDLQPYLRVAGLQGLDGIVQRLHDGV